MEKGIPGSAGVTPVTVAGIGLSGKTVSEVSEDNDRIMMEESASVFMEIMGVSGKRKGNRGTTTK